MRTESCMAASIKEYLHSYKVEHIKLCKTEASEVLKYYALTKSNIDIEDTLLKTNHKTDP